MLQARPALDSRPATPSVDKPSEEPADPTHISTPRAEQDSLVGYHTTDVSEDRSQWQVVLYRRPPIFSRSSASNEGGANSVATSVPSTPQRRQARRKAPSTPRHQQTSTSHLPPTPISNDRTLTRRDAPRMFSLIVYCFIRLSLHSAAPPSTPSKSESPKLKERRMKQSECTHSNFGASAYSPSI